jgi:D-xylose transport system ATP-binding protein
MTTTAPEPGAATGTSSVPVVEMRNIHVSFGGVRAVDDVTIDLRAGEVVGLVGGNGAGKSTLMKVLSGAQGPDSGEIRVGGRPVSISNPRDAKQLGIETIYQTLALADNLDAPGNLFLGRELTTPIGQIDDSAMEDQTRKVMGRLNPHFKAFRKPVVSLSGGQRQAVAIARTRLSDAKIVLMDEPTAAISVRQVAEVLNLIRELKRQNLAVILISHRMPDVFAVADRIAVLRRGRKVADKPVHTTSPHEITGLITGAIESV